MAAEPRRRALLRRLSGGLCALAAALLLLAPFLAAAESRHHHHDGQPEDCLICLWIQQAQSALAQAGAAAGGQSVPSLLPGPGALCLSTAAALVPATLIQQKVRMDD